VGQNRQGDQHDPVVEDSTLFSRFLDGDDDAFMALFDRHAPRLFLYCLKVVGSRQAAHDIMQDMWERIVRLRAEGKPTAHSPAGLLMTTTRNLCLNYKRDRKEHLSLDQVPEWRQPGSEMREMSELEEAVVLALDRLPDEQREVLILNAYSGYRFDEIAEMLGEGEGTIRARAWRARAKLGKIIAALIGLDQMDDEGRNSNDRSTGKRQ
jgi:RNA polymerase sigma-70 factor (ECF subfamily)